MLFLVFFPINHAKRSPKIPRTPTSKRYKLSEIESPDQSSVRDSRDGGQQLFDSGDQGILNWASVPSEDLPGAKDGVFLLGSEGER